MDDDYIYINKHIDSMPMFCNWEIDVIIAFTSCFYCGIVFANTFTSLFLFLISGLVISWLYAKIKSNSIKGYVKHIFYMFNIKEPKTLIPSYKKKFLGA